MVDLISNQMQYKSLGIAGTIDPPSKPSAHAIRDLQSGPERCAKACLKPVSGTNRNQTLSENPEHQPLVREKPHGRQIFLN